MNLNSLVNRQGNTKTLLVVLIIVAVVVFGCLAWVVGTLNGERRIKNAVVAQAKRNELMYDTMWKIISQKAQISQEWKSQFRDVFSDIMQQRYEKGGSFAKFVKEANPEFSPDLLKDLARSVEHERKSFMAEQDKSLRLKNEWDNMYSDIGSGMVLRMAGREQDVEILIVTSGQTKRVFEKGEDNEVDLFPR